MKASMKLTALALCAGIALVGCGGDGDGSTPPQGPGPTGAKADMTGQLTAPDGETPITNARIYQSGTAKALKAAAADSTCPDAPSDALASACTDSSGNFNLEVVYGSDCKITLNVIKGAIKESFEIDACPASGSNSVVLTDPLTLSANPSQGGLKMAVVTGSYDNMEDVLAKLGYGEVDASGSLELGTETFDLYRGGGGYSLDPAKYGTMADLFEGNTLSEYDIVFFNCGVDEYTVSPDDPDVKAKLRAYVESGGRLYATDWSYDYVEQAFPEFIDFVGDDATVNAATQGANMSTVAGSVKDVNLKGFLQSVSCGNGESCLNPDGTVTLTHWLGGWAGMEGAEPGAEGKVNFYVQGAVDIAGETGVVKPLTASFEVEAGKVIYSSYHTEGDANPQISGQERILQYLVFE